MSNVVRGVVKDGGVRDLEVDLEDVVAPPDDKGGSGGPQPMMNCGGCGGCGCGGCGGCGGCRCGGCRCGGCRCGGCRCGGCH